MILVTGATGNVGQELVLQLAWEGSSVRIVTRDKSKASSAPAGVEVLEGEITDQSFADRALKGIERLFLFPILADKSHDSTRVLLSAAKKNGVKHIVMLSSLAARTDTTAIGVRHREKEILIEESGIDWTFVRPGGFMSNAYQWLPSINALRKVFNPTGAGRMAPISPSDIAATASRALTEPGHEGKIYSLTGPQLLSVPEQVEILSKVLDKKLECMDVTPEQAAAQAAQHGVPDFIAESLVTMWSAIAENKLAMQADDLQEVTGSRGQTFEQWCKNNHEKFLTPSMAR